MKTTHRSSIPSPAFIAVDGNFTENQKTYAAVPKRSQEKWSRVISICRSSRRLCISVNDGRKLAGLAWEPIESGADPIRPLNTTSRKPTKTRRIVSRYYGRSSDLKALQWRYMYILRHSCYRKLQWNFYIHCYVCYVQQWELACRRAVPGSTEEGIDEKLTWFYFKQQNIIIDTDWFSEEPRKLLPRP